MSGAVTDPRHTTVDLPAPDAPTEVWDEWSAAIPHDCEVEDVAPASTDAGAGRRRLAGIDAARGLALLGMVAVHVVNAGQDEVSLPWRLSSGSSSALFALLGGIGLAFMSGRTRIPSGKEWWRSTRRLTVRGLAILVIGLLLGEVIPVDKAGVILPYLGLLFVLSVFFLRLRSRTLFLLAGAWAVGGPVLSNLLRAGAEEPFAVNLTVGDVVAAPAGSLEYILVSGLYPVLTWFPYLLAGLGLGRLDLSARRHVLGITLAGAALWLGATAASWWALQAGGLERLAADESGRLRLEELTGLLVWGGNGTAPATSWWWFASAAPHTGLPLDLARTTGVALLVLGVSMATASVADRLVRPLAVPGSMTLTLYTLHLLLLLPVLIEGLPDGLGYVAHVAVLVAFAFLWHRFFSRGPLEALVWWLARLAGGPTTTGGSRNRHGRRRARWRT